MNRELITKQDYEILGIKENATPNEISVTCEKLLQQYHPEKIKLEKYREPNDLEIKKFKEIEEVYKKFDLKHAEYLCCGVKEGVRRCMNEFYPALWIKVEEGQKKYFCSQECYNSKWKSDELVEKWKKEDQEWERKKLAKAKKELQETKEREVNNIKKYLERAKVKQEQLEPNNRNYEQEIKQFDIKEADDSEWIKPLYEIINRVEKDIQSKSEQWEGNEKCDNCSKEIKKYKDENGHIVLGIGSVDNEGNRHKFCSWECSEKFRGGGKTAVRKNAFAELLKWMKKEGITNLSLDPNSGKLVVEYMTNNSKTIEDNELTPEQKEIKNFFQQNTTGKQSLSRSELEEQISALEGTKPKDKNWVMPLTIIGMGVIILVLIGVIVQKSRRRKY